VKRRLSPDETAIWDKVAATVTPLRDRLRTPGAAPLAPVVDPTPPPEPVRRPAGRVPAPLPLRSDPRQPHRPLDLHGLDSGWERKLSKGTIQPDFSLDLHGATLDTAHSRLDHGLAQAVAHGARIVLLVMGRPRPNEDHGHRSADGRSERRGAIRAKFMDWLTAGPHASRIAAVRPAHPRHGGAGAVYIILKRPR